MNELPESDRAGDAPHPRDTFDLLGHERAEALYRMSKRSGRMHHAWLISGPSGVGKATLAYRMIRDLLGGRGLLDDSLDIPASDPVAGRISARGHGNLKVVRRPYDPKTKKTRAEIPVSEVRALGDFFHETAAEGGRARIALIDKADHLNVSSENAVLKLLEEPPENGVLILLSDAPGRLLPTIRSRCFALDLRPVPDAQLKPWLAERVSQSGRDLDQILFLAEGSPGRALALADNFTDVVKPISELSEGLAGGRGARDIVLASNLAVAKNAEARALYWSGLQSLLAAYARGEDVPFAGPDGSREWSTLWADAVERQRTEGEINMNKQASLLDTLSAVRAG